MIQTRPIVEWPGAMTPANKRRPKRYDASYNTNRKELMNELRHVKARDAFIQAAYRDNQIRIDGFPYAGARPTHPGIIVTYTDQAGEMFDFACDTFADPQQNLRAIVLTLQRLRLINEAGMKTAGRQYQGFKRLDAKPAGAGAGMPTDIHQAAELLASYTDGELRPLDILARPDALRDAWRMASVSTHPDTGQSGSDAVFKRVARAKEILTQHHQQRAHA